VVECAGLENQSPGNRTAGSNPAPSAHMVLAAVRYRKLEIDGRRQLPRALTG
jgi:hypothetical protein